QHVRVIPFEAMGDQSTGNRGQVSTSTEIQNSLDYPATQPHRHITSIDDDLPIAILKVDDGTFPDQGAISADPDLVAPRPQTASQGTAVSGATSQVNGDLSARGIVELTAP